MRGSPAVVPTVALVLAHFLTVGCSRECPYDTATLVPARADCGLDSVETAVFPSFLAYAQRRSQRSQLLIASIDHAEGGQGTSGELRFAFLRGFRDRPTGSHYYTTPTDSFMVAGGGSVDVGVSAEPDAVVFAATGKLPLRTNREYHILNYLTLAPVVEIADTQDEQTFTYGGSLVFQFNRELYMPLVVTPYLTWLGIDGPEGREEFRGIGCLTLMIDELEHGVAMLGFERNWRWPSSTGQEDGMKITGRIYAPRSGIWCGIEYKEHPASTRIQVGKHVLRSEGRVLRHNIWVSIGTSDGVVDGSLGFIWSP